jgi:hypothetical protein
MFIQDPIKSVTQVDLVAAVIPNTMYNITIEQIFILNGNPIIIPPGFYSACKLATAIAGAQSDVSVSLSETEGKFIFTNGTSWTLDSISPEFSKIAKISQPGTYVSLKSESVINMNPSGDFVFLEIDELRPPYPIDAVSNPLQSESFRKFATVPIDSISGTFKIFKEMSDYKISVRYPSPIDRIDRLTIRWLDTNGNLLNFNGVEENFMILRFHYQKQINTIMDVKVLNNTVPMYMVIAIILLIIILK